jgi:hypothetical protein
MLVGASAVSRIKYLSVSLFLLALIAWIVEGLIATETITFSPISMPDFSNLLAESLQYLVFLAFFAVAAGSLIVMILDRRMLIESLKGLISQPQDASSQSTLKRLLTWTVSFGIIFAFVWLLTSGGIKSFLGLEGGQPPTPGDGDGSGGGASPTLPPNGTSVPESPLMPTLFLVSGVLLIAAVFVGGLLFVQAVREIREEAMVPPPEEALQEEALTVVGEAISEITAYEGDLDFRAAIIKCYRRLCELLAQHNCQIQKHETVQEFRISASKLLNLPDEPLFTLTNLFEEARYSIHEINEAKRNEALKCLEEIRDHLTGGKND